MEGKVSRIIVLEFLKRRESGEGNIGGGVKRKVIFRGKCRGDSKRQEGAISRDRKIVRLGSNIRQPERIRRQIGIQYRWEISLKAGLVIQTGGHPRGEIREKEKKISQIGRLH